MATKSHGTAIAGDGDATTERATEATGNDLTQVDRSTERMLRVVRPARRVAVVTLAVEGAALVGCVLFLGAPTAAPVTVLTFLVLGGLFVTIALAVVAVAAAMQRLAMPHTPVDDEIEAHVGWRAPVAVIIFVAAVLVSLVAVPAGVPIVRDGQQGYDATGPTFVRLSEEAFAELVLQQLRFVATFATVFAAWVAMSLTRHHPGWDAPRSR